MENCKEKSTPMCQKEKLSENDEDEKVDETLYRSLVCCLIYILLQLDLTFNMLKDFYLSSAIVQLILILKQVKG